MTRRKPHTVGTTMRRTGQEKIVECTYCGTGVTITVYPDDPARIRLRKPACDNCFQERRNRIEFRRRKPHTVEDRNGVRQTNDEVDTDKPS